MIHIDIMDNHFVKNLTFGPIICKSLVQNGVDIPLDIHLMTNPVKNIIQDLATVRPKYISFHIEIEKDILENIKLIKSIGSLAGLAINPNTSIQKLEKYFKYIDMILLMSVTPGFGGQTFINSTYDKIKKLKILLNNHYPNIKIAIDGGVNIKNIKLLYSFGIDIFVLGSAIFNAKNRIEMFNKINNILTIK